MRISRFDDPPIIAITMGDPGGIGPEVAVKALAKIFRKGRFLRKIPSPLDIDSFRFLWIGLPSVFEKAMRAAGVKVRYRIVGNRSPQSTVHSPQFKTHSSERFLYPWTVDCGLSTEDCRQIGLLDIGIHRQFKIGRPSRSNALLAFASLRIGAHLALTGQAAALVTAPLHKASIRQFDSGFIGHTEYLGKLSRSRRTAMLFDNGPFRVALVTTHLPLKEVSRHLTSSSIVGTIDLTNQYLRKYYSMTKPKIAVCALNPHGEEFGREEKEVIQPAIVRARRKGIRVTGPFPSDHLFFYARQRGFDAIVAMYHDQGLVPFKMLAFDRGVNVTLGLPFIRTSPDHGTAFDIAYKGKADERPMLESLLLPLRFLKK